MAAYMVVYARIRDDEKFKRYVEALGPIFQTHGAKLLARGMPPTVLEGDWPWQTAGVLSFPSVDAAVAMWNSPEYVAAKKLRAEISDFFVTVSAGVE
jgi:uncharacterized protein (DUF1330 family)